jgi:hypothetical protein
MLIQIINIIANNIYTHTRLWPIASDFVVTAGVAGFCDPLSAHFRMF